MGLKSVVATGWLTVERALRGRRMAVDPGAVKSVLVLENRIPLGCCVHLTPVLEAIKLARPDITLTVATRGLGAEVLRHHPGVDHLILTENALDDLMGATRTLRAKLKRLGVRPDCVLTGSSDRQTSIAVWAMLSAAGWRGGFTLLPELYQRPLTYDRDKSLIDNNLKVAGLLGGPTEHREPAVYFSAADVATAEGLAREANPGGRPLLTFVTQGSGDQSTGWHTERWAEVLRFCDQQLGCAVAYVGTKGHAEPVEALRVASGGVGVSLTGRTSVPELAALLAMSDGVVSVDTGSLHVGRAVGVPMVVIGPSWQKPIEWMPLGLDRAIVLRGEDRVGVPPGYQLDEIQAPAVTAALQTLLQAFPPRAEDRAERLRMRLSVVDHFAR